MKKEITVVTAFFNIDRKNWRNFERTENEYFEYFKGWAKLKNNIIVYVESKELGLKILKFRKSIGLEEKTKINYVENIKDIDVELYKSIKKATENNIQQEFRLFNRNPEVWNTDYNYVMLLKMWCVQNAILKKQAQGMVAWVDFGYNHGGAVIDEESDFNFLWEYDFSEKIHLFLIQEIDVDRPIFDIIRCMDTYIMGTIIIGIDNFWNLFWELMKKSMKELNNVGLTDDDQNIILMSYYKNKNIFETHVSGWQLIMKEYGGNHLKIKEKKSKNKFLINFYANLKRKKKNIVYCIKTYNYLKNQRAH